MVKGAEPEGPLTPPVVVRAGAGPEAGRSDRRSDRHCPGSSEKRVSRVDEGGGWARPGEAREFSFRGAEKPSEGFSREEHDPLFALALALPSFGELVGQRRFCDQAVVGYELD